MDSFNHQFQSSFITFGDNNNNQQDDRQLYNNHLMNQNEQNLLSKHNFQTKLPYDFTEEPFPVDTCN